MDDPYDLNRFIAATDREILQDAAAGPLVAANANPVLEARYQAMTAAGQTVDNPAAIETFLAQRRTYILGLIASNATARFAVTSGAGGDFSTNKSLIALTGTAPPSARTSFHSTCSRPASA